jgi:hypothetical protein
MCRVPKTLKFVTWKENALSMPNPTWQTVKKLSRYWKVTQLKLVKRDKNIFNKRIWNKNIKKILKIEKI